MKKFYEAPSAEELVISSADILAISMNEGMYQALVPLKWTMLLLMIGLSFAGGNFCNFCPAIALSPVAVR